MLRIGRQKCVRLVAGCTEKPMGVDPSSWFPMGDGASYYLGCMPLELVRPNESGDLYDGTVSEGRVLDYCSRSIRLCPPVILTASRSDNGYLHVIDGGHRVSAARLRGDKTIFAILKVKPGKTLPKFLDPITRIGCIMESLPFVWWIAVRRAQYEVHDLAWAHDKHNERIGFFRYAFHATRGFFNGLLLKL